MRSTFLAAVLLALSVPAVPASAQEAVVFRHSDFAVRANTVVVVGLCLARIGWPASLTKRPEIFQLGQIHGFDEIDAIIDIQGDAAIFAASPGCFDYIRDSRPDGTIIPIDPAGF
jgi:hypothetical protein